jgi:hypothetical protein
MPDERASGTIAESLAAVVMSAGSDTISVMLRANTDAIATAGCRAGKS